MKLSLSWIFDHIQGSWRDIDVSQLIASFNTTTAEVDDVTKIDMSLDAMTLVRITSAQKGAVRGFSAELNQELSLPDRNDVESDLVYVVIQKGNKWVWATGIDWGGAKESMIAAVACDEKDFAGNWKRSFEAEDYIITVDNTSLTHRPDLWGHRGIAREVAAILKLPLKPLEGMLVNKNIQNYESKAPASSKDDFSYELKNFEYCSRIAALHIDSISYQRSLIWMAHRLARVDSKPIDAIVDSTNYVMFDIGQPMHAFDANTIAAKKIEPKLATDGEQLELLDGSTVTLTHEDLVISDGKKALGLAGIMGGKATSVSSKTTSVVIESASFNAYDVRRTSTRLKLRTESSSRFEKSLDPYNNVNALLRFLRLLQDNNIATTSSHDIASLGKVAEPLIINVAHAFIEKRLGISIPVDFVCETLQNLEFDVDVIKHGDTVEYNITVPTFRATKDVTLPEDIVEEVGRFYGFDAIPLKLPSMPLKSHDVHAIDVRRQIKEFMVASLRAHEIQNYALFDQHFLNKLNWQPDNAAQVKDPVSENWRYLVTSLIPHIVKAVTLNPVEDELRFFEMNNTWTQTSSSSLEEKKRLAGIVYKRKQTVDFYENKQIVHELTSWLKMPVEWKKEVAAPEWFHPCKSASLSVDGHLLGYAGMLNPIFSSRLIEGDAFIFELDADRLINYRPQPTRYEPLSKYPDTSRDISMMIPVNVTVDDILKLVASSDSRIFDVQLIDFFQKDDWKDQRSVTIRFHARNLESTLTHEEIDAIYDHAVKSLRTTLHAEIR